MQKENLQRPYKGLHTDNSFNSQPKDTYRFALNTVNETELGDLGFISNEEANELCAILPKNFVPIGKIYMTKSSVVLFLVSKDNKISEIGILEDNCKYVTYVNDASSSIKEKLNFKIEYQIQGTYRLRNGCERTVYFTDKFNKPRYFNFDSLLNFKDSTGDWSGKLFNLQKEYNKIPFFQKVSVLDSGGSLEPGGYNISIQYVDSSLNPTEWITTTQVIKIYNDLSSKEYRKINGSINSDVNYIDFPKTSKAIKVELSSLDTSFLYYRLAFIEATNGSGLINNVKYTEVIPTSKKSFIYIGTNIVSEGTEEEIAFFSNIIDKAGSIEQIENRLILGNIEGKQTNFCNLQKYASRIKADVITKTVVLNDINDPANPKNPTSSFNGTGYMPGEIYSFGVVYVFRDGSQSPVYHIPGKNPNINSGTVFAPSPQGNVYPMSNVNQGTSIYHSNNSCGIEDFWGRDSEGVPLKNKPIRHHRFPLRSEINKPLVTDVLGTSQDVSYYNLRLRVQGDLITPRTCPSATPNCGTDVVNPFEIRVTYQVDGEEFFFIESIDPDTYADESGSYILDLYQNSQYHGSSNFTNIIVEISDLTGVFQDVNTFDMTTYWNTPPAPTFTTEILPYTSTVQGRIHTTEILGIKFSGIDLPNIEDSSDEIVGYYIVRNERKEFDKTILDSAVLIPSVTNSKYVSHGLLQPETTNISDTVYGMIHPEHKFKDKEYLVYDEIIQQGNYKIIYRKYGKVNYDDVYDGTSYNSKYQKDGNDDGHDKDGSPTSRGLDGWSFNLISRDNIVSFEPKTSFNISSNNLKDIFYLDALENRSINDEAIDVYNITTDNKIGMINLDQAGLIPSSENLPYVILKKNLLDPYSNFRVLPYYKENTNLQNFDISNSQNTTCVIYNGDSYVTSMRYVNTTYWDNKIAKRKGRKSIIKTILGVALAVLGAILIATGIGAPAGALVIGAGISIIGGAALIIKSGVKQASFNRAYNQEYDKGLRQTTLDNWVDKFYNYRNTVPFTFLGNGGTGNDGPSDDTIQWIGDCITDLWFESTVNCSVRNHMVADTPTYLDAPGRIETGNNTPIFTWEFFGLNYTNSNAQRYPISTLERHLTKKLLAFSEERDDSRYYIGLALGEYYNVNEDYLRFNKQKVYFHLPLEYNCCSDCKEKFPHRIHYSEQSFQEELSDNYRVFLPNNYRDIEGERGEITNLYRLYNNLYIHTEESLWHLPQNYQERITNNIVSFIGTGSYFETPPRLVVDDSESSAGLKHKWGAIKTKHGIFFPSIDERKMYLFNGNKLKPISDTGMTNWFKQNMPSLVRDSFYNANTKEYPYLDNPSNILGEGFISTYDTKKERLIITKKDFKVNQVLLESNDFEICSNNGNIIVFNNFSNTINAQEALGYSFLGIQDCKLKFSKTEYITVQEEREITTVITTPNTADIWVMLDMSGSFNNTDRQNIINAVNQWHTSFATSNPDWVGNLYIYQNPSTPNSEDWIRCLEYIVQQPVYSGVNLNTLDIVVISFINENGDPAFGRTYHATDLVDPLDGPYPDFIVDRATFITLHNQLNSFLGITYPIVNPNINWTRGFLQHSLAALKGSSYTATEVNNIPINPGFTNVEWAVLLNSLQGVNPYDNDGLENYGWIGQWDRMGDGSSVVLDANTFQNDISALLEANKVLTTQTVLVDVLTPITTYLYVNGTPLVEPLIQANNSWTMSYSLKNNTWTSWHSYLPNFYIHTPEKFYSTIYEDNNIWKHNAKNLYHTYYGKKYPHIIEYVSSSSPVTTTISNHLRLLTEAKKYDVNTNQYVEERFVTFNKAVLYNSRQCTGELNLIVKDTETSQNYLSNQIVNLNNNNVIIDRNEKDWTLNDLRDIRIDYTKPIWDSNIMSLQTNYYIDKVLNTVTLDTNKDWTQLESFRDKYLVVRLIFDIFANIKLITNFTSENEQQSFR